MDESAYEYALRTPRSRERHFEVGTVDRHLMSPCTPCESSPPPAPWPTPLTPPRTPLKPLQFTEYSDRLIPSRAGSKMETGFDLLAENQKTPQLPGHSQGDPGAFARLLRNELLGLSSPGSERDEWRTPERGLFRYKSQVEEMETTALLSASTAMETPCKVARRFPAAPYKVLSAPGLEDDYYLNLLDWSAEDQLAVGLNHDVDLWNATTGRAKRLCELEISVCSLRWAKRSFSNHLALGLADGEVQIWDTTQGVQVQRLRGHSRRCCALAWAGSVEIFSGSQDTSILHWDLRQPCDGRPAQRLMAHTEEVCGLSWSEELQLLASGGNEGNVFLWGRSDRAERRLGSHNAACKALDWSSRGVLATGGGTADKSIRLWSAATGVQTAQVETEAQVCNLAWSLDGELISTHGFSTCEVNVWKSHAGGLSQLHAFHWHQARVLYLAMSPDGQSAAMGTGNEMLCFWHLSPKHAKVSTTSSSSSMSKGSSLTRTIR